MATTDIEVWKFSWEIVSKLAVGAWVVVPAFWKYGKPYIEERNYMRLSPSRRGAKALRRLAKKLGQMRFWLSYDSDMARRIRLSLFKTENEIMTESFSYIAIHSDKDDERCSALRYLSQVEGKEIMSYAERTMNAVISDGSTSDGVKKIAKVALNELKNRQQMVEEQTTP